MEINICDTFRAVLVYRLKHLTLSQHTHPRLHLLLTYFLDISNIYDIPHFSEFKSNNLEMNRINILQLSLDIYLTLDVFFKALGISHFLLVLNLLIIED